MFLEAVDRLISIQKLLQKNFYDDLEDDTKTVYVKILRIFMNYLLSQPSRAGMGKVVFHHETSNMGNMNVLQMSIRLYACQSCCFAVMFNVLYIF